MRGDKVRVPSVDERLLSLKLGDFSFSTMISILVEDMEKTEAREWVEVAEGERIQAFILLFILSCDRWIRSSKVDERDKIVLKEKRRMARAFFIDISKRMERKPGNAWVDAPLPNRETLENLAEGWVRQGMAKNKEEVYALQNEAREQTRIRSEEQRKDYVPTYAWTDAPLFGIPKTPGDVKEGKEE